MDCPAEPGNDADESTSTKLGMIACLPYCLRREFRIGCFQLLQADNIGRRLVKPIERVMNQRDLQRRTELR